MKTKLPLLHFLSCILFLLALSPSPSALSQIPQGFNYQAIARDESTGNPISDPIDVKIAILSDDDPETIIREELHSVDPDDHGLFSLVVGKGSWVSGLTNFSDIDWTVTPKYIRTMIFYGGVWKNMGPAQLWSVPYAMYSPSSNPWLLNGSSLYYSMGYVGIETDIPVAPLTVRLNDNTGITYPLYLQNQSGDWTATEKGVGLKFGRLNPTSGHDYGTIRGTIASANGGAGRLQLIGGGGTDPHMTINHLGYVGIGTTSPADLLHVNGNTIVEGMIAGRYSTGYGYVLQVGNDSRIVDINIANTLGIYGITDETQGHIRLGSSGPIISGVNGYVGIGTISPGLRLHSAGTMGPPATSGAVQTGHLRLGTGDLVLDFGDLVSPAWGMWLQATNKTDLSYKYNILLNPNGGNVGIGTTSPSGKLDIQPSADWSDETPLFEVKNNHGVAVLAIYNNGVRINVEHDPDGIKGPKGGFNIGGYDYTKGGTYTLMNVTPDSIRFNINNGTSKGPKGGFAIGGFGVTKGDINEDFMYITPQSSNGGNYSTKMGFEAGKNSGGPHNTFVGVYAGKGAASNGSASNIFIGEASGKNNSGGYTEFPLLLPDGTWITAFNSWGGNNVAVGNYTGVNLKGDFLHQSLGQCNVLLGHSSGTKLEIGSGNVIIGHGAGSSLVSGNGNIFIGRNAGGNETTSDKLYIDNSNTSAPLIYGDFYNDWLTINGILEVSGYYADLTLHPKSGDVNKISMISLFGTFGTGATDLTARNFATIEVGSSNAGWSGAYFRVLGRVNDGNPFETMKINTSNGDFYVSANAYKPGGGSWLSSSDFYLKDINGNFVKGLQEILNLNPVLFNYKKGNPRNLPSENQYIGFIAQEVREFIPEAVSAREDGYLDLDMHVINVAMVNAIKEQQKLIEGQQKQIDRLEALVEEMMEHK